jgi:hypothetical protein
MAAGNCPFGLAPQERCQVIGLKAEFSKVHLGLLPGVALLGDITYNTRDPFSNSGDSPTISTVLAIELYY